MRANGVQFFLEDTYGRLQTSSGWVKPTKCVPITFFYKNNKENMKNEKVNNTRCNFFTDDAEQKEDTGKY